MIYMHCNIVNEEKEKKKRAKQNIKRNFLNRACIHTVNIEANESFV